MSELSFPQLLAALAPDIAEPVAEFRFSKSRRWRFDFCWPERKVAVEISNGFWKPGGGRHSTDGDRDKRNTAASMGWRVLEWTDKALADDPDYCLSLLRLALG